MRSDTSREPTRGRAPRGASPRPARAALHHRPIPAWVWSARGAGLRERAGKRL